MQRIWKGCALLIVCVFSQATGFSQDKEQRWDMRFESFFNGTAPLSIYARERGNQWISGVGSSIKPGSLKYSFNKSYHPVDMSRIPIQDGKITGAITLHIVPDSWIPASHRCFDVDMEVQATVTNGQIAGVWKKIRVNPEDASAQQFNASGAVTGSAREFTPPTMPEQVTFNLNLGGAIPGGQPSFGDRTLIAEVGCEKGQLVSLRVGYMGGKKELASPANVPVSQSSITYGLDGLSGKLVFPYKDADANVCQYTFEFDGRLMETFNVGTYKMTAVVEGRPPVQQVGAFDGSWKAGTRAAVQVDARPWWIPVAGFKPVQSGEHPRLLFRKDQVAALRERAKTPEGQAIIARLKVLLGGGEAMPTQVSPSTKAYEAKKAMPFGAYSFSHAAGFGLLYQLTGDRKYADLAKECFEWALAGKRNTDDRYAWRNPGGALRAGPTLGWYAVAYDLAYDGWDESTRRKYAQALSEYNDGKEEGDAKALLNLETLVRGTQPPGSNHYGMQVGGAAIVLLAVMGDAGVRDETIQRLLKVSEDSMIRNISEGFGDGGFFAEGDGTGSMASHIIYDTALLCWKNAKGMDFISGPRPNARMINLKWIYLTIVRNGRPDFWPIRGAYGHNVWSRDDLSGSGYFAIGMGNVTDEQRLAMKGYYDLFLANADKTAGCPFDTVSRYPHVAVSSFVNWPIGVQGKNPAEVLPLCYRDSRVNFFAWRNRWQDENDVVMSILAKTTTAGNYHASAESSLKVAAQGKKFDWGVMKSDTRSFQSTPMGQTSVLNFVDGASLGVDFTLASGADALLVYTGKADGKTVSLGDKTVTLKFLSSGADPEVKVEGDKILVGRQTVILRDGAVVFGTSGK